MSGSFLFLNAVEISRAEKDFFVRFICFGVAIIHAISSADKNFIVRFICFGVVIIIRKKCRKK
jgi:hypothetical protein